VPVLVVFRPDAPLELRVAYEVLGFTTLTRPLAAEDLMEKAAAAEDPMEKAPAAAK
jgi:hypothetical protein